MFRLLWEIRERSAGVEAASVPSSVPKTQWRCEPVQLDFEKYIHVSQRFVFDLSRAVQDDETGNADLATFVRLIYFASWLR